MAKDQYGKHVDMLPPQFHIDETDGTSWLVCHLTPKQRHMMRKIDALGNVIDPGHFYAQVDASTFYFLRAAHALIDVSFAPDFRMISVHTNDSGTQVIRIRFDPYAQPVSLARLICNAAIGEQIERRIGAAVDDYRASAFVVRNGKGKHVARHRAIFTALQPFQTRRWQSVSPDDAMSLARRIDRLFHKMDIELLASPHGSFADETGSTKDAPRIAPVFPKSLEAAVEANQPMRSIEDAFAANKAKHDAGEIIHKRQQYHA